LEREKYLIKIQQSLSHIQICQIQFAIEKIMQIGQILLKIGRISNINFQISAKKFCFLGKKSNKSKNKWAKGIFEFITTNFSE
jgi:Zn finger protein HypA/HybF involved in hydrogenase expression